MNCFGRIWSLFLPEKMRVQPIVLTSNLESVKKGIWHQTYLIAYHHTEDHQKYCHGQFMKDSKWTKDVSKDLLQEEGFCQNWQHSEHIHNVEDSNGDEDGRDKRLEIMTFPTAPFERRKNWSTWHKHYFNCGRDLTWGLLNLGHELVWNSRGRRAHICNYHLPSISFLFTPIFLL